MTRLPTTSPKLRGGIQAMVFSEKLILGRTGLKAGRLGISSSYGAPAQAFEEAFEKGCNYFTWGTFIKGRSSKMKEAIRNIVKRGAREELILAVLSYAHDAWLTDIFLNRGLKTLGIDYADILILGYYPKRPSQRTIDGALRLKEKGLLRFIGLTSHNRRLFPELEREGLFDVFHIRYNAAHRGAETETFPYLEKQGGAGIVSFTATAWSKLSKPKKMPPGETPLTAPDCYRFVLSNPSVHICMMGAKNIQQMRENLTVLDGSPMTEKELNRLRRIGDHVYGKGKGKG
jgi:predicted aldo/keto reductase-like oxidoreductase